MKNDFDTGLHYPIDMDSIPQSWEAEFVGVFATDVQSGFACGSHNSDAEGLAHLRPMNVSRDGKIDLSEIKYVPPDYDERRLVKGDVLFNNTNSPELIGKTAFVTKSGAGAAFSNHMTRLRFNEAVDPKFAALQLHYLWMMKYFLHRCVKHVNQASVSSRDMACSVPLVVPPLNEQHRIVAKIEALFSELDKGIESLKTAREQLKVYRQAVLKHAFEGKLTAQWREENKDKLRLPESISGNNRQGEKQLLESVDIPEVWGWSIVRDILLEGPSNGRSVKDRADGFPVLRLTALKKGRIDLAEHKYGDWNRETALPFIVKPGDFLLSRGNGSKHLVGRGGVVPEHKGDVAFPDTMVRLRVDPSVMHIDFFRLLWESRVVRNQIELAARTTAGIYKINQNHIQSFWIPIPSIDEQRTIIALLEEKLSVVEELERDLEIRLAASEALRQSILKKAFSGQLVPQDPNDEPASVLLERIKAEKAQRIGSGSARNSKRKTRAVHKEVI